MQNVLNVVLLLASVFTCLALGVASAYGLCNLLFAGLRLRAVKTAPVAVSKLPGMAGV